MRSIFQQSSSSGPHTSSIGVAGLEFHWSKKLLNSISGKRILYHVTQTKKTVLTVRKFKSYCFKSNLPLLFSFSSMMCVTDPTILFLVSKISPSLVHFILISYHLSPQFFSRSWTFFHFTISCYHSCLCPIQCIFCPDN